jgi:glycine cleavage system H lipoate-binding protein
MDFRFENFLGREIVIPSDRLYDPIEGLWVRKLEDGRLAVGMTEPTVLMAGAVREVEVLVENDSKVASGETAVLVLTAKLKYIAAPISGKVTCPPDMSSLPAKIIEDPYGTALFYILPEKDEMEKLVDAAGYVDSLKDSDGARNPGGHKGGVSPTCKAVYMALGEQRIKE